MYPSLPCRCEGYARCWVGGPPSSSILWPRARGARCRVLGSPSAPWMRVVDARCQVRGTPLLPPLGGHTHYTRAAVRGVSVLCRCPPACRALGARADRPSPPYLSPSAPGCSPPLWPRGRPLLRGSPRRLDRPPAPLAPVSRTCSTIACRFWPFGAVRMPVQGPCTVSVRHRVLLWDQRRRRPWTTRHYLVADAGSARLGYSGGGGVSVPSPPPFVVPRLYFSLSGHPGGFVPPG